MLETSRHGRSQEFLFKGSIIYSAFSPGPKQQSEGSHYQRTLSMDLWKYNRSLVMAGVEGVTGGGGGGLRTAGPTDELRRWLHVTSPLLCLTLLLPDFIRTFPVVDTGFMLSVHHVPSLTALLVSLRDLCLAPFCFLVWRLLSTTLPRHMQSIFSSTWIIPHIITWSWHSAQTAEFLLICKSEALLFHTCQRLLAFLFVHYVTNTGSQVVLSQSIALLRITLNSRQTWLNDLFSRTAWVSWCQKG